MLCSPPMSAVAADDDIAAYEGLVIKTAQMFAGMVGLEMDDMRQELRLKVLKSRRSYNPARSKMTEKAYVYACLANFVKDLKRDAARRRNGRLVVVHIQDFEDGTEQLDWFEFTYSRVTHDEVFGRIEDGSFRLPATVTEAEQNVLVLLVLDYSQPEIAAYLDVSYGAVKTAVRALREKLRDWAPTPVEPAAQLPLQAPAGALSAAVAA